MQAFIIANSFLNIIASALDSEKGYKTSGTANAVVSVLAFRKFSCCIVDGYYCCVFDRHCHFFLSFLQDCVMYCTGSQAYFMVLNARLSVTDAICFHFHFSVSRPGMGGI